MKRWARRIRGAIGMGVAWAAAWALGGMLIGVTSILFPGRLWDRVFALFDAPLPALAVPGFVGGAIFSVVLGIAGRRRRFDQLSLPRFAAWGAAGGLLLSLVPAGMATIGLATFNVDPWRFTATIAGPLIVLSALSAAGSLALARRGANRDRQGGQSHPGDARAIGADAPDLIGGASSSVDAPLGAPPRERERTERKRGRRDG